MIKEIHVAKIHSSIIITGQEKTEVIGTQPKNPPVKK